MKAFLDQFQGMKDESAYIITNIAMEIFFLLIFLTNIQYAINIISLNGFNGPVWVPSSIYDGIVMRKCSVSLNKQIFKPIFESWILLNSVKDANEKYNIHNYLKYSNGEFQHACWMHVTSCSHHLIGLGISSQFFICCSSAVIVNSASSQSEGEKRWAGGMSYAAWVF